VPPDPVARSSSITGVLCGAGAFVLWGVFPIYFKLVAAVPAPEVLAHRIVWSMVFVGGLIAIRRRWSAVGAVLANRRLLATLALSATVVSLNWVVYIWAVGEGRILGASLGYYINPLVSVVLGVVVLGERLRVTQWAAVGLAVAAVGWQIVGFGAVPWVALTLAISFGFYGLIRKVALVDAFTGMFVETLVLSPLAFGYLVFVAVVGGGAFGRLGLQMDALLVLSGVITPLPLILFVAGAQRIRLSTVGLLQYIAPTGQFLLAVFLYDEPFTRDNLVTFALIWLALALYTVDTLRHERRRGPRKAVT
jgi:chloramphenicol-sensitive protein RarD